MSTNLWKEELEKFIEPFLKEAQVVLVDFHVRCAGGNFHIEILADKPTGGITMEECAKLNRALRDAIEMQNLILENYVLEVSSPGVDRPLKTAGDFKRTIGRKAHFFLSRSIANKIEHIGVIKRLEADDVIVESNQNEIRIPLNAINQVKQII